MEALTIKSKVYRYCLTLGRLRSIANWRIRSNLLSRYDRQKRNKGGEAGAQWNFGGFSSRKIELGDAVRLRGMPGSRLG